MRKWCEGIRIRWKGHYAPCTNQASSRSPDKVTASPLYPLSSLIFPLQTVVRPLSVITFPTVLPGTRISERDSFTRNEAMSPHSDDTPQRRDQSRPGVNPDLMTMPPTTTVVLTSAPKIGQQDSEWENWSAAAMMNRNDRRCFNSSALPRHPRSRIRLVSSHLARH